MKPNVKWTAEVYSTLYRTMTRRFGPHDTWESKTYPSKERLADFEAFLESIRVLAGATSTQAVLNQIQWATTRQNSANGKGHVILMMINKAFALQTGFIDWNSIPEMALTSYGQSRKLKPSSEGLHDGLRSQQVGCVN